MKIRQTIPPATLNACTALLAPHVPEISAVSLIEALKGHTAGQAAPIAEVRPMTRAQAAELLQVHKSTVNRWMQSGLLRRVKINGRTVRISRESVEALLAGKSADTTGEG